MRIREEVGKYIQRLQALAQTLAARCPAELCCGGRAAAFGAPLLRSAARRLKGRHVVVEKVMGAQSYSNSTLLTRTGHPAGLLSEYERKSTYTAPAGYHRHYGTGWGSMCPLICQRLPLFDAIFTRIGAVMICRVSQSTFMVEMMEANRTIRQASERSLILFDELGPWDGDLRWDGATQAIIEHHYTGAKTLLPPTIMELTALRIA